LRKEISKNSIESFSDVTAELKVLSLILANRHMRSLIKQDISGHQNWIRIQTQT
jgi:hypothetical protein